jgi:hypothetical protein
MPNGDKLGSRTATGGGDKMVDMGDGRVISFPGTMPDAAIELWAKNEKAPQQAPQAKPGFFGTIGQRIGDWWKGSDDSGKASPYTAEGTAQQIQQGEAQQRQSEAADVARKQSGRSLGYRIAAAAGTGMGVNVPAQEHSADIGDPGGVLGNAAADIAPLVAGEVAGRAAGGASKLRSRIGAAIRDPITGRVMKPSEIALSKAFPDPNTVERAQAQAAPINAKVAAERTQGFADRVKAAEDARQQQLADTGKLESQYGGEQATAIRRDMAAREASLVSEAPGGYTGLASARGGMGVPGSPAQEAGYQPPLTKVPIRPEPPNPLTPEQVPGPDTAGKGNLLTPAARRGDPRAGQELMRRGRGVLYVPAEEYPGTRLSGTLQERITPPESPNLTQRTATLTAAPSGDIPQGSPTPYEGPNRRVGPDSYKGPERRAGLEDWQSAIASTPPGQATPGEALSQRIRQSSAAPAGANEGLVMRQIMRDPEMYAKFRSADPKTQQAMMVAMQRQMGGNGAPAPAPAPVRPDRLAQRTARERAARIREARQ